MSDLRQAGAAAHTGPPRRSSHLFWRRSAAAIGLPLMLVLVFLYAESSSLLNGLDGYWESATIRAMSALLIVGPICCACAAWEVGRLRRGRVFEQPAARPVLRILARALAPVFAIGLVGLGEAILLVAAKLHAHSGTPDPRLLAMAVAVLAGHIGLGAVLGWLLPPYVAAPAGLTVTYAWLVYPQALATMSIRHLTGFESSCCLIDTTIPGRAILAPALVALGLVLAAVALVSLRRRAPGALAAVALVAAAVGGAARLVQGFGPDPVQARTTATVCSGRAVRVCVWPEHRAALATLVPVAARLQTALAGDGIAMPTLATESARQSKRFPSSFVFAVLGEDSPVDQQAALAGGMVPAAEPECPSSSWQGASAVPILQAWLAVRSGLTVDQLATLHSPDLLAVLTNELAQPPQVQGEWYRTNLAAVTGCGQQPVGIPQLRRSRYLRQGSTR